MSRKPSDVVANSLEPKGRQAVWEHIRKLQADWFTTGQIFEPTQIPRRTISSYLSCLENGGYVESRRSPKGTVEFRLLRDVGVHAPRLSRDGTPVISGNGNDNLWRSMRILKQFSPLDLAVHSTTDTVKVGLKTAKTYCVMLLATGYLRIVQRASNAGTGRLATYRLIRNSGPLHPEIQKIKQVFDPNTNAVYLKGGVS